jgi:CBS domain-containing protein
MSAEVWSVLRTTPAHEIAMTFATKRVSSVPVLEDGRVVGVVSRTDLVRLLANEHATGDWLLDGIAAAEGQKDDERASRIAEFVGRRIEGKAAHQIMSDDAITVDADQELHEVARCLIEHRIHHAPVVEGGKVVGVISTFDITRWVAQEGP